jgi:hypothetical protein
MKQMLTLLLGVVTVLTLGANLAVACTELKDPFLAPPPDPCAPNCGSTWGEYDPDTGTGTHIVQGLVTTVSTTTDTCAAAINLDPRIRVESIALVNNATGDSLEEFSDFEFSRKLTHQLTQGNAGPSIYWAFTAVPKQSVPEGIPVRFVIKYSLPSPFQFLTRVGVATLFANTNLVSGKVSLNRNDKFEFTDQVTLTDLGVVHVCTSPIDPVTGQCN